MTASIDLKALQLTIILLRQYKPQLAKLLPGPNQYPMPDKSVELHLGKEQIADIVHALTELGEQWLTESQQVQGENSRNRLRQQCIGYLLKQWITVGEEFEQPQRQQLH